MTRQPGSLPRSSPGTANGRRTRRLLGDLVADLERGCADAGLSMRTLASIAGVDPGYLSQVRAGQRSPSVAVLNALAVALGGSLSIKFFPGTGPAVRDARQASIVEALLRIAHPAWDPAVEVGVSRPVRGFVDVVLRHRHLPLVVATEVETRLDRLEQELRWAADKAAALPSSEMWTHLEGDPAISRLLVLRSTSATRDLAREFEATLAAAYPATARDVFAAVVDGAPWPGPGILWANVEASATNILPVPPRGVRLGR